MVADDSGNPRVWTRQDGSPAASFEVNAQTVRFLGGKDDAVSVGAPEDAAGFGPETDDEIPF
jgi:single-strand DNA-binding protein